MNKILSLLLITAALASCDQSQTASKKNTITKVNFDSAYQPATFTDAGRMEKIMQAFPVIDKIFKDYADSNHLPGVAYGLVVDGKLVYKGNIGYTDIEKKIAVTSSSLLKEGVEISFFNKLVALFANMDICSFITVGKFIIIQSLIFQSVLCSINIAVVVLPFSSETLVMYDVRC